MAISFSMEEEKKIRREETVLIQRSSLFSRQRPGRTQPHVSHRHFSPHADSRALRHRLAAATRPHQTPWYRHAPLLASVHTAALNSISARKRHPPPRKGGYTQPRVAAREGFTTAVSGTMHSRLQEMRSKNQRDAVLCRR